MAKLASTSSGTVGTSTEPLWNNERERMVFIAKQYQSFVEVLFLKLKECFDRSLFSLPDAKTLMYSGEDALSYQFRCGANLKLTLPKSIAVDTFTPKDIDTLLDRVSLEVNNTPVSSESWKAYPLFRLEPVKKRTTKAVDSIVGGAERGPKDRSARGRLGRVVDKLLPGDKHHPHSAQEGATEETVVPKNHVDTVLKFPTITIK